MRSLLNKLHVKLWFWKRFLKILLISTTNRVILITGIPRSGSTLVFNICRILLKHSDVIHIPYWINDVPMNLCLRGVFILKIHHYDALIASLPLTFIHTTRNLKEVASSATVKGNREPSIEHIKNLHMWDIKWKDKADIVLNYSDLLDLNKSIKELAEILQVKVQSFERINEEIASMQEPTTEIYDKVSQLNYRHHTGAGRNWKEILSESLIKKIDEIA